MITSNRTTRNQTKMRKFKLRKPREKVIVDRKSRSAARGMKRMHETTEGEYS